MPKREDKNNFIGKKYNRLTILDEAGKNIHGARMVLAKCDCGCEIITLLSHIRSSVNSSCGCLYGINREKIVGNKYGLLTIIQVESENKKRVIAECVCGNKNSYSAKKILDGGVTSCGCERRTKNGKSSHPLHKVWSHMMDRCYDIRNEKYHCYGGRGVVVCEEWKVYYNFYKWGVDRWQAGLQLDKDVLSPERTGIVYSPNFCCFITPKQNSRNRSNNLMLSYKGQEKCLSEWVELLELSYDRVKQRINKLGWSVEKAFECPVKKII